MATWESKFTLPGTSAQIYGVMEVNVASQNIATNSSVVNWEYRLEERSSGTSPYRAYHDCAASVSLEGVVVYSSSSLDYNFSAAYATISVASGSYTIAHWADGTRTFPVSGAYDGKSPIGTSTAGGDMVLPTIPRASWSSFSTYNFNAGTPITVYTNRASSGFTHTIEYSFAGWGWNTAGTGVADSLTFTPPLSLVSLIPGNVEGGLTIRTTTYSGGTLIGVTTATVTMKVPSAVLPTFTTVTHSEAVPAVAVGAGAYVQGLSKYNLEITGAAGAYGSWITGYQISVAGQTINAVSGVTPDPIASSGTVNIIATVTDSRGRSVARTVATTVLPYAAPVLNAPTLFRRAALATGALDPQTGQAIRVDLNFSISSLVVGGTQKNYTSYQVLVREKGTPTWTFVSASTPGGTSFNGFNYWGTYGLQKSWEIQAIVSDKFSTVVTTGVIAVAEIFMHWGGVGQGLGVGKFWERGGLDVKGQIYQNDGAKVLDEGNGPRGVVFWAESLSGPDDLLGPGARIGVNEIAFTPQAGRLYEVTWHPLMVHGSIGGWDSQPANISTYITVRTDGSKPLKGDAYWARTSGRTTDAYWYTFPDVTRIFSVSTTPAQPMRFLGNFYCEYISSGSMTIGYAGGPQWWRITDIGPKTATTGNALTYNNGS